MTDKPDWMALAFECERAAAAIKHWHNEPDDAGRQESRREAVKSRGIGLLERLISSLEECDEDDLFLIGHTPEAKSLLALLAAATRQALAAAKETDRG